MKYFLASLSLSELPGIVIIHHFVPVMCYFFNNFYLVLYCVSDPQIETLCHLQMIKSLINTSDIRKLNFLKTLITYQLFLKACLF